MAFGKSFSTAKSNIKEKSMEYLRNVTNRTAAEPQDRKRLQPSTPSPPPDRTSTPNTPSTSTPTPKNPIPNIPSTPPSTLPSKPSPDSKRTASSSSSSTIKNHNPSTPAKHEKHKQEQQEHENENENENAKQQDTISHTDPLPSSKHELEGLRNTLVSQLQKLADRVECINEWMEMDAIVLARLVEVVGRGDGERKKGREFYAPTRISTSSPTTPTPATRRILLPPTTTNTNTNTSTSLTTHSSRLVDPTRPLLSRQERINNSCAVRELQRRIKCMRGWRRDLESCVRWVREEERRVRGVGGWDAGKEGGEGGSGNGDGSGEGEGEGEGDVDGDGSEERWGVSGWKWVKSSGRVPTVREWKGLFSDGRMGRGDAGGGEGGGGGKGYYQ